MTHIQNWKMLLAFLMIVISSIECVKQCSISKEWYESEKRTSHITASDKNYESNGNETHYDFKSGSVIIVSCKSNRNR